VASFSYLYPAIKTLFLARTRELGEFDKDVLFALNYTLKTALGMVRLIVLMVTNAYH
jgi:hypothetical protein